MLDVDILIPWLCFLGPPGLGEKRRTAVRWFVFVAFLRLGASVCGEQVQLCAVKKTMLRCSGVSKQISGFSPPFFFSHAHRTCGDFEMAASSLSRESVFDNEI